MTQVLSAVGAEGSSARPDSRAETSALAMRLHAFRRLGGNCEFGFVQRYGGAEPSGLLRFSYTPIDDLIHALSTDFAAYGAPGDLRVEPTEGHTYYCRSSRYNIWSNTAQAVGSIDPVILLRREYGRVAHLKRKMLAELARGSKILVRKVGQGETEADFERLAGAIRRHGPSILLRVTASGAGWRPEPVRWTGDGLLAGSVRRFAPTEQAWDLDLEPWLRLCDSAYAARYGLSEALLSLGPFADAIALPGRRRRHRGRTRDHGFSAFARPLDPDAFDPEKIYAFSAWVQIPEDFSGSRVFAIAGRERLGAGDADLTIRGRWQRVWAASRIRPARERLRVGLGLIGSRRDRFWSCGWTLHEGPVPRPADPPPVAVCSPLRSWFLGWRS